MPRGAAVERATARVVRNSAPRVGVTRRFRYSFTKSRVEPFVTRPVAPSFPESAPASPALRPRMLRSVFDSRAEPRLRQPWSRCVKRISGPALPVHNLNM